jgi:DNA end-binding protein Ku
VRARRSASTSSSKKTGNRIRYSKVDAETGEEVDSDDIIKGYQVSKGQYVEITDEDLEAVAVESTRTIDIDQFVPREEIDDLYNIRPYFIAPEGKVGADAFVTIREAIAATGKVALGRLVLTTREHMIALEPRGKGLMGTLLRYPYEVRDEADYFEDIPNIKKGDARSRKAHCADQGRPLRTGQVRGPLRDGATRGHQ